MNEFRNIFAFVFPGQGSQSVGMLADLAENNREVKQIFASASQIIGTDLWKLTQEGPAQTLNLTQNTQPVMLAAGFAVWSVWCKKTARRPEWMAGHSLGEYTALVCSGAISFEDAIGLVFKRARLMQQAVAPKVGAMAAIIGLDDPQIVKICSQLDGEEIVQPVNFNAPGQVVIAGHAGAVQRAIELAKDKGARRAVILPVSVPSHCKLMEPAAEKLWPHLRNAVIESPQIPIIHNVDVASHAAPEAIKNILQKQLFNPVRWVESIKFMHQQGVDCFIECGSGKTLTGLNKRIVKDSTTLSIFDAQSLNKAIGAI